MPMQKQKKKLADMLKNLKNGDIVTTSAELWVQSFRFEPDTIVIKS